MTTDIRLPAFSPTMAEGILVRWHKAVGDRVSIGDVIAEIETDKVTVDYEAVDAGVLIRRLVDEGTTVQVQDIIAVLELGSNSVPVLLTAEPRPVASPMARRLARELAIDLATIRGTGPNGRITKADVIDGRTQPSVAPAAIGQRKPEAEASNGVELSSLRRVIAGRMQASKQTIPHFYVAEDVRVDALLALKGSINACEGISVGVNHLVLKAAAIATSAVPAFNAAYVDERLVQYDSVDIGMAIALPQGLVAPVLRGLARKTVRAIADEARALASRAKDGALRADDLQGGGITVSNLGTHDVRAFTAIINPPQVAILAVGVARSQPVVDDGQLVVGTILSVTLSADHRIIDGVVASRWMHALKRALEQPLELLLY